MNACARYLVLGAVALIGLGSAAQAKPSLTGTLGGGGGTPFSIYCGINRGYLTGIEVRSGAWIDGIRAACFAPDAAGFLNRFRASVYDIYVGGPGGDRTTDVACLGNQGDRVVSWLTVEVVRHPNGATFVSNLWIDCLRIVPPGDRPGGSTPRPSGANLPGASYEVAGSLKCPEGRWAVGLYGTAGIYIDSIGLICDTAPGVVERLFSAPTINGAGVDLCLNWGTGCGAPAADEFCRRQGFSASADHAVQNDAPPTYILGDNLVCNDPTCDRFSAITCR